MPCDLIVILGPTASGKTRIAARLARDLGSEIISADSRQVYRGMDIGTGKDLAEYVVDGVVVPCHLIDIVDPVYEFNVFEYRKRFFQSYREIRERNLVPVMCGGTGLYIEAVLLNYRMAAVPKDPSTRRELESEDMEMLRTRLIDLNPTAHNTTDLLERERLIRAIEIAQATRTTDDCGEDDAPRIDPIVIGIHWEREILRRRITERLHERLGAGLIDEVKRLHDAGVTWEKLAFFGLEYRCVGLLLQGELNYEQMIERLNTKIHQFAKRQETWFRRMERKGITIHWIDGYDYRTVMDLAVKAIA